MQLTYTKALERLKRCRNHGKGARLDYNTRLFFGDNGDIKLCSSSGVNCLAKLHPNNTATVYLVPVPRRAYEKWLGLYFHRDRNGLYAYQQRAYSDLYLRLSSQGSHADAFKTMVGSAAPAVDGMMFDLETGKHLNPTPRQVRKATDTAGAWRSKVTRFRKGLLLRAKLGCYDSVASNVEFRRIAADDLKRWIEEEDYNAAGPYFVTTTRYLWYSERNLSASERVTVAFDRCYDRHRDEVRLLAGCYTMCQPSRF